MDTQAVKLFALTQELTELLEDEDQRSKFQETLNSLKKEMCHA